MRWRSILLKNEHFAKQFIGDSRPLILAANGLLSNLH